MIAHAQADFNKLLFTTKFSGIAVTSSMTY